VSTKDTRQRHSLPSASYLTLGKESALPSVCFRLSAKTNGRQLQTAANGPLPRAIFAECLPLGKGLFAECFAVLSALHSVNCLVTERRTLPRATLGKVVFAECPIKSTQQRRRHSAKARISVVDTWTTTTTIDSVGRSWCSVVGDASTSELGPEHSVGALVKVGAPWRCN
jgi:hypothetical protein